MVNKVILIGNIGQDPELRQTTSGTAVCNFRMATHERIYGSKEEKTEWHRIVVFGAQADIVAKYQKKGKLVYVEGRIQTRKWEDNEGKARYTTEIVAKDVKFLSKADGSNETPPADNTPPTEDDVPF